MQSPAVAVDGHRAPQAVESAAAHRVERNHIERVALPNRLNSFQSEEIMSFAPSTDGVDIFCASNIDGFVIKTDTLHAVDQIDESRFLHAGHLGAEYMLQLAVGCLEQHLRGRFHHHQVALFHNVVEKPKVGHLEGGVVG